jgi:hypothetical protein
MSVRLKLILWFHVNLDPPMTIMLQVEDWAEIRRLRRAEGWGSGSSSCFRSCTPGRILTPDPPSGFCDRFRELLWILIWVWPSLANLAKLLVAEGVLIADLGSI